MNIMGKRGDVFVVYRCCMYSECMGLISGVCAAHHGSLNDVVLF